MLREMETEALFQVQGVCERERVRIAFQAHKCMDIMSTESAVTHS